MKNKRYQIRTNYCNCHPETCCCDDYAVWDIKKDKKLTTVYSFNNAKYLTKQLNKLVKKKKGKKK